LTIAGHWNGGRRSLAACLQGSHSPELSDGEHRWQPSDRLDKVGIAEQTQQFMGFEASLSLLPIISQTKVTRAVASGHQVEKFRSHPLVLVSSILGNRFFR
jgi:hypothetical protein